MAHDAVPMFPAKEAPFGAAAWILIRMIFDAIGQMQALPQGSQIQKAIEISPFPAKVRPGLAAIRLGDAALDEFSFKRLQMIAHGNALFG